MEWFGIRRILIIPFFGSRGPLVQIQSSRPGNQGFTAHAVNLFHFKVDINVDKFTVKTVNVNR